MNTFAISVTIFFLIIIFETSARSGGRGGGGARGGGRGFRGGGGGKFGHAGRIHYGSSSFRENVFLNPTSSKTYFTPGPASNTYIINQPSNPVMFVLLSQFFFN
ncbi:uncharacterized protein CELE_F21C10.5 [Caenorhabditis elegans]|uniref:Uncharacterized protein n=1 Tax=Caenorhabditis elegans TaxID=6239 RepID=Q19665_CAEEL|nr:Uncharacterized protein CELE_F21C10.5 [Caenorhabditis elegans]CCD61436.1 Uncharacterized protein CELE_F21C10.5 [Caenorhabditis elegans]|eukprot:NP_505365.1 Uncharacterized protein CELE_F21C10.5 [Caenorhabditis elegans]